jgi:hypothetical protein
MSHHVASASARSAAGVAAAIRGPAGHIAARRGALQVVIE